MTFPTELKLRDQWCVWRMEERDGKRTKVPYRVDGERAKANDPRTWSSWSAADRAVGFDGLGFMFHESDPYVGVDFDDCYIDGELSPAASRIVEALASYTEITPSGRGLHVIVRGRWNASRHRTKHTGWGGHFEVYDRERFFTMTEGLGEIGYRQAWLDQLGRRMTPPKQPSVAVPLEVALPDDADLLRRALENPGTAALWRGETEAYGEDASAADLALCTRLAFWTGPDPPRVDHLYRRSGLMRAKWDQRRGKTTYGRQTVANAVRRQNAYYGAPPTALPVGNPFLTAQASVVPVSGSGETLS